MSFTNPKIQGEMSVWEMLRVLREAIGYSEPADMWRVLLHHHNRWHLRVLTPSFTSRLRRFYEEFVLQPICGKPVTLEKAKETSHSW